MLNINSFFCLLFSIFSGKECIVALLFIVAFIGYWLVWTRNISFLFCFVFVLFFIQGELNFSLYFNKQSFKVIINHVWGMNYFCILEFGNVLHLNFTRKVREGGWGGGAGIGDFSDRVKKWPWFYKCISTQEICET